MTVLPSVIASLCIVGALVWVDAMSAPRNIARQIVMQDGHCLIALKDNQTVLKGLVETIFSSASPLSTHMTEEKGHGREEKRSCVFTSLRLRVYFYSSSFHRHSA